MKEHQQGGKVNCPKCGADECFRRPGEFRCGSGNCVDADDFDQSDICKELCELRSKLTPEGAGPLVWIDFIPGKVIDCVGIYGRWRITDQSTWGCRVHLTAISRSGAVESLHDTIDDAKAYAEELHQKAFAEFVEKWGRK